MNTHRTSLRESAARQIIDSILSNLGWIINEQQPDCNVFTERSKTKAQSKKLRRKRPDYVLYESETDRPIAVIEAKRPGRTLTQAIKESIEKYAKPLSVNIVFATDGVLTEVFDLRANGPLLLDGEPITNLLSPPLLLKFANEGAVLVTPTKTLQTKQALIDVFSYANDILRKEGLRRRN